MAYAEDAALESSVCTYVISLLTRNENDFITSGGEWSRESEPAMQLSYRLCMANVLISACQKISEPGKKLLAKRILQPVITSSEVLRFTISMFFLVKLAILLAHFCSAGRLL